MADYSSDKLVHKSSMTESGSLFDILPRLFESVTLQTWSHPTTLLGTYFWERSLASGFDLATTQPEIILDVESYKGFVNQSVGSYKNMLVNPEVKSAQVLWFD